MVETYSLLEDNITAKSVAWCLSCIGILSNLYVILQRAKLRKISVRVGPYTTQAPASNTHQPRTVKKTTIKLNRVSIFLIKNLAVADLCGSLYLLLVVASDAYYATNKPKLYSMGNNRMPNRTNLWLISPACSVARMLLAVSITMSHIITLFIAIDRYITFVFINSRYKIDLNRSKIIVVLCWLIGISISLIITIRSRFFIDYDGSDSYNIFVNLCYVGSFHDILLKSMVFITIAIMCLSYLIMIALYLAIAHHIRKTRMAVRPVESGSSGEKRILLLVVLITMTSFIAFLPFTVIVILIQDSNMRIHHGIIPICFFLVFANAAFNPIIYSLLSSRLFRRFYRKLGCCHSKGLSHSETTTISKSQNSIIA
ncbi:uncharacterized protein TRIADDRAFT_60281 [Trichoplax adhaerens]|uniref:G-protein coupled receptors family 1 profile domain-containing protein n=1 Tax=Trichoplax adhaerens TaxID=10228 RepID=B3S7T0_TRIAD|nr:hypothetical protein TRIADDRAFT_60281 [Trichoplax adhaerens]EDV21344.1 hypothetical protein TRIADDRAFT_60281 [Trichoplax adhaerens]|eukprot:XP_002116311.1 hypothetical protein TRIADDRAFT_60281 [Trichoplax adhaerens]